MFDVAKVKGTVDHDREFAEVNGLQEEIVSPGFDGPLGIFA